MAQSNSGIDDGDSRGETGGGVSLGFLGRNRLRGEVRVVFRRIEKDSMKRAIDGLSSKGRPWT
jgi:hypothetical protein